MAERKRIFSLMISPSMVERIKKVLKTDQSIGSYIRGAVREVLRRDEK